MTKTKTAKANMSDRGAGDAAPHHAEPEHALDAQIIAALQEDGRLTNMALSRRFNVSEASVRQRLKKLYETRAVRSCVVADFRAMGLRHMALVRFRIAPNALKETIASIVRLQHFPYVAMCSGTHNVIAFCLTEDAQTLTGILDTRFRTNPGIHSIEVQTVVSAPGFDPNTAFL